MNNPSPLVPQGSTLEQKNKSRARVRLAVFVVLSLHVVGLMALLMLGCRKTNEAEIAPTETNPPAPATMEASNPPPAGTNVLPTTAAPPTVETTPPPAAPAVQEYIVSKGDSFYTIARKFGVTMKAIQDANPNVQPTKLQIGQKLQIPVAASTPGAASAGGQTGGAVAGGEQTYTVKSGDTLTKIAAQFGTTVKAIRSENSLTTDKIIVGQKLKIPPKASAPETAPAAPSAPAPAPAPANPTT
jgi:LysM repeat protein